MRRLPVLVLVFAALFSLSAAADVQLRPDRLEDADVFLRYVGDFNGDGLDDVLFQGNLLFNLGGRFAPPVGTDIPWTSTDYPRAVANLNGDAYADVVVRGERGVDALFLGNGSAGFTAKQLAADDGVVVEAFDFTGDGLTDLLQWKPGQLVLKRNVGNATFALHQTFPWGNSFAHMESAPPTADLNGDGRLDFIMAEENAMIFYLAQPDGTFRTRERFTRTRPALVDTGDLNGDGHLDIAFVSLVHDEEAITAIYGDGTGRFPEYARLIPERGSAYKRPSTRNILVHNVIEGGADEISYGTHEGGVIVLSGIGGQLREVSRTTVDGLDIEVRALRFRSAARELVAEGHIRYHANRATWHVDVDGTINAAQLRSRGRAVRRIIPAAGSGTHRLDIESDCPVSGLTEWQYEREGVFVNFTPNEQIQSARAVFFPLGFYVEMLVKDGARTRELTGWLEITPEGMKGKLMELKPPCGGRWVSHDVTAIPMR